MQNDAIQSIANITFPTYANWDGDLLDVYVKENDGIAVSFRRYKDEPLFKPRTFLLKYYNEAYHVSDAAKLNYSNASVEGGQYGVGVAYDGTDLFVSDIHDKTNATSGGYPCDNKSASGAVYVYRVKNAIENSMNGSQKVTTALGSENEYEYNGYSTATNGNWAFSGSPYDQDANLSGSVTVAKKEGGQWKFVKKIYQSLGTSYDYYGRALDADNTTLVVGAPGVEEGGKNQIGEVYLYQINSLENNYISYSTVRCPDKVNGQYFGYAVAIDGNYLAVGAVYDDAQGSNAGAVYIFKKTNNVWTYQQKITGIGGTGSQFGYALAMDGGNLVIGEPFATNTRGASAGYIYYYQLSGNTFNYLNRFSPPAAGDYQYFGSSVSLSGTIGCASTYRHNNNSGYVKLYTKGANSWIAGTTLYGDNQTNSNFGQTVVVEGDKIVVGATGQSKVFRYQKQGSSWIENGAIENTNTYYFGFNVSISGDQVMIGCPYSEDYQGSAYLINYWNISGARAGLEQFDETVSAVGDIILYPNPVSGELVNINSIGEVLKVTAYNTIGDEIGALSVENNQINISSLSAGVYVLQIETTEGSFTKKLMKE